MRANQLRLSSASMADALLCALRRIGVAHTPFASANCGNPPEAAEAQRADQYHRPAYRDSLRFRLHAMQAPLPFADEQRAGFEFDPLAGCRLARSERFCLAVWGCRTTKPLQRRLVETP
jgi:hypothetical protein